MGTSYDGALYAKYKNDANIFIETGAYIGDGIQGALTAGFDQIISIELAQCQYNFCINRFEGNEKVHLILGDTRKLLRDVLVKNSKKHNKMFLWLDAHCSGGSTEGDSIDITLPQEMKIVFDFLKEYQIEASILIDDATASIESMVEQFIKNYDAYIVCKEPCINPYTNLRETNRDIIVIMTNT